MTTSAFMSFVEVFIGIFNRCRTLLMSFTIAGISMWWWMLGLLGLQILMTILRHVSIGEGGNNEGGSK